MIPIPQKRQSLFKQQELSESFRDVCAVVEQTDNTLGVANPNNPIISKFSDIPQKKNQARASSLLHSEVAGGEKGHCSRPSLQAKQEGENDVAEIVIVCEPEGASLEMGGLHPRASLYEKPVNLEAAKLAHAEFRNIMRENNVRVLTVREILSFGADMHVGARVELEHFATKALSYVMADGYTNADVNPKDRYYLSDEYKLKVLEEMSVSQLINVILINPTVHLSPSYRDTGLAASYSFQPLSNLVYTRDQQITTAKGIIMGRLRSPQRGLEVSLMRFCFQKLGLKVLGEIEHPGYLEGGDFCPASKDLAFIGVGLRSNEEACHQVMNKDWFGYNRVAIVKDCFEQSQDRMHLDCVFALLSETCCLALEDMLGKDSPTHRLVDEYEYIYEQKRYRLKRQNIEFSNYLSDNGFNVIPIKGCHQLEYACNILNLGNERILSVHPETARDIVKSPYFHGDVQCIDYSPITSMYGAVHCSSQVVKRRSR